MNTIWKRTVFSSYLLTLIFGDSPLHERYHTYEEIQTQLEEWNDEFGDSVNIYPGSGIIYHLEELGTSTEDGLPFWAVKLSYNANLDEDEPKILFLGQCHAEEILGVEITMELINKFLNPSPSYHLQNMQAILQSAEVWIVPTYNPEGLTVVHGDSADGNWLQDISYRKNKRDVNLNGIFDFDNTAEAGNDSDGVDLNRNYNFNWIFGDGAWVEDYGSYQSHFDYYRGESPFSENETQFIRDFALEKQFLLSIAYHSSRSGNVSEQIIFPWMWDGGKSSPDYPVISSLATGISNLIPTETGVEFANYVPVASVSRKGNAHDWFYTETGCVQFLIEAGTANMQPDNLELIEDTIERNLEGALHLMNRGIGYFIGDFAADAYQVTGIVTDASNGNSIDSAIIKISEMDGPMLKPRVTDQFGRYRRLLTNGTFTLNVSARGYENQSFSITPSSSSQTVQDISLIPLETRSLELNIATPSDYSESVQLLLTDQYKTDTLQIGNGNFSIQIPENHYTIKIIGENLFPYFNKIDLTADTSLTIDMNFAGEWFNEPFPNLSNWTIESGEWHVDNGTLISQSDLIYPNSLNSILSSWINNPDYQSLALSLDFQYEMEWENDTAYVAILGNEDTTVFHWTDQNWQFHTECLPFITNSDSFRIQIGIIPDNTVEYRGIKIHNLAILNQSDNNASIGNFDSHVPDQYLLHQNYPNPFNPVTSITYELPLKSHVQLAIYDLTGKEVIKLVNEFKDSGKHGVKWNGSRISSGIYFYVLDT
ncbi:MAG TPA: M14 family zinc carboxypeptidase, partial [Candidatus Marinimicrobia bacterium]|nr:M14 family zinc carboxypeptidase [Candidatus Neomarinimicrobiota bacterium]